MNVAIIIHNFFLFSKICFLYSYRKFTLKNDIKINFFFFEKKFIFIGGGGFVNFISIIWNL